MKNATNDPCYRIREDLSLRVWDVPVENAPDLAQPHARHLAECAACRAFTSRLQRLAGGLAASRARRPGAGVKRTLLARAAALAPSGGPRREPRSRKLVLRGGLRVAALVLGFLGVWRGLGTDGAADPGARERSPHVSVSASPLGQVARILEATGADSEESRLIATLTRVAVHEHHTPEFSR